jgi:LmbE family N-acetylglucosaminyl deacetylase
MKHIYLSPHLDDGVLSCGGAIHRRLAAGEAVLVITLFAGDPPAADALSPFAQGQPAHQTGAPRPAALRRAEDLAALALLGADVRHLAFPDAIYRRLPDGVWPYDDLAGLLGEVDPADPVTPEALAGEVVACLPGDEPVTLYAPLAVGRHVDHQLVHRAARLLSEQGYDVAFYEDYPYAEPSDAVAAALAAADAEDWRVEIVGLSSADLTAKVAALAYYHSQLAVLFGEAGAMPGRVWSFAVDCSSETGLGERIWRQP